MGVDFVICDQDGQVLDSVACKSLVWDGYEHTDVTSGAFGARARRDSTRSDPDFRFLDTEGMKGFAEDIKTHLAENHPWSLEEDGLLTYKPNQEELNKLVKEQYFDELLQFYEREKKKVEMFMYDGYDLGHLYRLIEIKDMLLKHSQVEETYAFFSF
jgi:hypothetical protein